ncbi:tripartite tricarboxylate transporter substrate binding protein [Maritalea mediterranea]|uniref:Tripartite tricarboxylate transporter substrate binding protein n=1 Tax=Maritalea mediterranea TaxID=2909667 RepID=A0ABS9E917_9HYPH|nr:tripartite tricarboxylate transporter substrate binding protein [Maritalea mediterranea]MCF4099283.1 tripartite tricarboxylate transporter substrate binding protein [Maritalea mediterranea]
MKRFIAVACATLLSMAAPAMADEWAPDGPIELQIGFGAGGETDTLGRVIASTIEEQTGWSVVPQNKPGGGGIAMFTGLMNQDADGSVIGMGVSMPVLINLTLRGDQLPFDLDSFDYLGTVTRAQLAIIAQADAPFDDIASLVEYSKEQGGVPVAFDAKPQELMLMALNEQTGAGFKLVSTKSSAEMVQFVLGGQVDAAFNAGTHIQYLQKGDVKMLASANADRHSYAPDVPTLQEQGYDLYTDPYFYFAAPQGLDDHAKAGLAKALDDAIKSDNVQNVVRNAMQNSTNNLGPDGTKKMMEDGLKSVGDLFN